MIHLKTRYCIQAQVFLAIMPIKRKKSIRGNLMRYSPDERHESATSTRGAGLKE
jgi:hypothetical protein